MSRAKRVLNCFVAGAIGWLAYGSGAVYGAGPSMFTVSASVQAAVAITEVEPMSFGTLIAREVNASQVSLGDIQVVVPASTLEKTKLSSVGYSGVSLGGGAVPGRYQLPAIAGAGRLKLRVTNESGIQPATSNCRYPDAKAALAAGAVVLTPVGNSGPGFLCVASFTSYPAGLLSGTGYAPPESSQAVAFNLGATLTTPVFAGGKPTLFATGTYRGSVSLELVLP